MTEQEKSRSLRFNLELVTAEIARWPIATFLIMTVFAVATILLPDPNSNLDPADRALLLAGLLLAGLGMKGLMLLATYPRLHKCNFPGSYLKATSIAFIPIFAFYAVALGSLAKSIGEELPIAQFAIFMLVAYPIFVLFFAGFMRAMHTILAFKGNLPGLKRQIPRTAPPPDSTRHVDPTK